ncbi:unnamed protein product [Rhodiola kirilowii]
MLEKTFSTFYASNVTLQQQYRVRVSKGIQKLIACLLIAEKNNELLIKNHQSRPTGSKAFPEANVFVSTELNIEIILQGQEYSRGSWLEVEVVGSWRGRGYGQGRGRGGYFHTSPYKITKYGHKNHQDGRNHENPYKRENDPNPSKGL